MSCASCGACKALDASSPPPCSATPPAGTELRVYFEPEETDDLLHSQVGRFDIGVREERATALN